MRGCLLLAVACVALHQVPAVAQEVTADPLTLELYEGPVATERPPLHYPPSAAQLGREGWVELNFMVDPQGKAYEVVVADSVGDEAFIRAAEEHLQSTVFRPARLGDEIVDGSARMMYRFVLENGEDAARRVFGAHYRRFIRALGEEPQAEATEELRRLEGADIQNNYEYAYLSLARYFYAERYGTPIEQMEHLKQAIGESTARPELASFLGEDAVGPRRGLFQLQVRNRHFAEALDTLQLMRLRGDDEGAELFGEVLERLDALRSNDEQFGVPGQLGSNGSWFIELFKDDFYLAELSGTVRELKLRCQRSFVFFEFDPEIRYNVSNRAGECSLEVVGDPGTSFTLVQG